MRNHARCFACVAFIFLTSINVSPAADAAGCKPLQILNSVKMEENKDGTRYLVPVTVNGKPLKFLLDTGGAISHITRESAKSLGLREESSRIHMFDMYGNESQTRITAKSFGMGVMRGTDVGLQIAPSPQLAQEGMDGILSSDLFKAYDVDMDFGASRLNYFSQDHCEGKVAYWAERPIAIVPFTELGNHINLSVTVDGHAMRAIIDTGAENSVMTATEFQKDFAIVPGAPEAPLDEQLTKDNKLKSYTHPFNTLSFEGLTVANPNITIMVDRMMAGLTTNSIKGSITDPFAREADPLTIGMNVLKHLHIYIAYGEKKLYITPAGTGESVLFKSAAPAAGP